MLLVNVWLKVPPQVFHYKKCWIIKHFESSSKVYETDNKISIALIFKKDLQHLSIPFIINIKICFIAFRLIFHFKQRKPYYSLFKKKLNIPSILFLKSARSFMSCTYFFFNVRWKSTSEIMLMFTLNAL